MTAMNHSTSFAAFNPTDVVRSAMEHVGCNVCGSDLRMSTDGQGGRVEFCPICDRGAPSPAPAIRTRPDPAALLETADSLCCGECDAVLVLVCPSGCKDPTHHIRKNGVAKLRAPRPDMVKPPRTCKCGNRLEDGRRVCTPCRVPARLCKCGSVIPRVAVVPGKRQFRLCEPCRIGKQAKEVPS